MPIDAEQRAKNFAVIATEFRDYCQELEGDVARLSAQLEFAREALEYITKDDIRGPTASTIAHDALVQLSVME